MRQRRRRQEQDMHNSERWLISYADFITLLFAFFVVMYSVSSVNEGKYKVLSETLTGVFNASQRSVVPIAVGERVSQPDNRPDESVIRPPVAQSPANTAEEEAERTDALRTMANQLSDTFEELINQGLISVETNDEWIELTLRNSLLFGSGDAEPHYDAFPVIESIAKVLADKDNAIRVEGFTDDRPIQTRAFPSNWELSAARAAAVVRLLSMNKVDPQRMAAIGYGQFQPVARNDTTEGRKRNRRVVLLISRDASIRGAVR
ncbi:flagellar motor protein MotD [Marinobacter sp. BGYM27]|uniref:flagellar motor protein MotD n=1 Tax=Marinobacter sp. BGYM27 TaxID=2975597 RepID=UPI0021A32D73|nr:flagellar motor protein MotD [Marinobacter sp. BGYM27]MDG5498616.1 flagellar motor protein MotD [Marinobacter sp. BGYM27]